MNELQQAIRRELAELRGHSHYIDELAGEDLPVGELARTLVQLGDINQSLYRLADRLEELARRPEAEPRYQKIFRHAHIPILSHPGRNA